MHDGTAKMKLNSVLEDLAVHQKHINIKNDDIVVDNLY